MCNAITRGPLLSLLMLSLLYRILNDTYNLTKWKSLVVLIFTLVFHFSSYRLKLDTEPNGICSEYFSNPASLIGLLSINHELVLDSFYTFYHGNTSESSSHASARSYLQYCELYENDWTSERRKKDNTPLYPVDEQRTRARAGRFTVVLL